MITRWILFLLISPLSLMAQENKIVDVLNKQLQREISMQLNAPEFSGDTIFVVQPYAIRDGVLSVTVRKFEQYRNRYIVIRQQVPLSAIDALIKDVNIVLRTKGEGDVWTITTESDGKESLARSDLFFTQLYLEKNNAAFGKKLIDAFRSAGYHVLLDEWYD